LDETIKPLPLNPKTGTLSGIKLGTHHYPFSISPEGYKSIDSFRYNTNPEWTYRVNDLVFKKELLLVKGEERIILKYSVTEGSEPVEFWFEPYLAFRNIHELTKANLYASKKFEKASNGVKMRLYSGFSNLYMQFSKKVEYISVPDWYYNVEYPVERERGYDFREDLFRPGYFKLNLKKGDVLYLTAGLEEINPTKISVLFNKETKSNITLDSPVKCLENAAEQFIVSGEKSTSVMAGFHWFEEWGRDTFIALPGLTLSTDKPELFKKVIDSSLKGLKNGLFPNMGKGENAAYNSADAPLWFFWALQQYSLYPRLGAGGINIWKEYGSKMKSILENFKKGTLYNIYARDNGLLYAGENGIAVTWMDAMVNGKPVTPRTGLAVEINALWYNAVCFALECAKDNDAKFVKNWQHYPAEIERSFRQTFWDDNKGYLADCVNDNYTDWSLRPNQVIATSLPYSPTTPEMKRKVLEIVKEKLLTPRGLRTLSPDDTNYCGTYGGSQAQRDWAYHQGTVWTWLLGHYAEACLNIHGLEAYDHVQSIIDGFTDGLAEYGLGTIGEIFDGNEPHLPKGAISQAWSVAELLRINKMLKRIVTETAIVSDKKYNEEAVV
jgi:predicted glycogen debranching enzyme